MNEDEDTTDSLAEEFQKNVFIDSVSNYDENSSDDDFDENVGSKSGYGDIGG